MCRANHLCHALSSVVTQVILNRNKYATDSPDQHGESKTLKAGRTKKVLQNQTSYGVYSKAQWLPQSHGRFYENDELMKTVYMVITELWTATEKRFSATSWIQIQRNDFSKLTSACDISPSCSEAHGILMFWGSEEDESTARESNLTS